MTHGGNVAFISDLLVAAAALGAALYCFILSRRLQALSRLDGGLGSAIALLSAQVDDLSRTLRQARENADSGVAALDGQTARAEAACQRLELLLATMHDLPEDALHRTGRGAPPGNAAPGSGPAVNGRGEGRGEGMSAGSFAAQMPQASHEAASRARIVRRRQPLERV